MLHHVTPQVKIAHLHKLNVFYEKPEEKHLRKSDGIPSHRGTLYNQSKDRDNVEGLASSQNALDMKSMKETQMM